MSKALSLIMKEISDHFGIKQSRLFSLECVIGSILADTPVIIKKEFVIKKVEVIKEVETIKEIDLSRNMDDYIPTKINMANVSGNLKAQIKKEIMQEMKEKRKARKKPMNNNTFCKSQKWRELRYNALVKYGAKCALCGATASDDVLCVDHIKPKSKYPELAYDINNLQVLCATCNNGKLDKHEHDFR